MKLKKILALMCCAVLLVCISVGATIAYLTDEEEVVNTFTVGNVQITLDEALVNTYGEPLKTNDDNTTTVVDDVKDADRVVENSYKLLPAHEYTKDPTVTVLAGSEACYVRAIVTLTKGAAIHALPAEYKIADCFDVQEDAWTYKSEKYDAATDTYTYEFWHNGIVALSEEDTELDPVFTTVTMPKNITNEELATLDGLEITVTAHAIQADGFDDATAAWGAWDEE